MKAKVREEDGNHSLIQVGQNHTHQDLEGPIVAEKIQDEMKTEYEIDFRKTTWEVLQSVMKRYKLKYDQKLVWQSIVEYLPADKDLCRNLRKHKADSIGNIPCGRDALDLQKILEGMLASGGDHVAAAEVYPIFERKERFCGVTKNVSPKIFEIDPHHADTNLQADIFNGGVPPPPLHFLVIL